MRNIAAILARLAMPCLLTGQRPLAGVQLVYRPRVPEKRTRRSARQSGVIVATIPHGNSVLALGRSSRFNGAPTIPAVNGLPIGVNQDLSRPYLAPYKQFHDNLFRGLFDPTAPHALLEAANQGVAIKRTTQLEVDTTIPSGGIVNIPFIIRQANASSMKSTFWIQELEEKDTSGKAQAEAAVSADCPPGFLREARRYPGPDPVAAREHQHAGMGRGIERLIARSKRRASPVSPWFSGAF